MCVIGGFGRALLLIIIIDFITNKYYPLGYIVVKIAIFDPKYLFYAWKHLPIEKIKSL